MFYVYFVRYPKKFKNKCKMFFRIPGILFTRNIILQQLKSFNDLAALRKKLIDYNLYLLRGFGCFGFIEN